MIEAIAGAVAVALAWGWRLSFDAGRAHQRRLSILNPGEAIIIDHAAMRRSLMMTKPDFEKLGEAARDATEEIYRFDAAFRVANPYASMKVAGIS